MATLKLITTAKIVSLKKLSIIHGLVFSVHIRKFAVYVKVLPANMKYLNASKTYISRSSHGIPLDLVIFWNAYTALTTPIVFINL